VETSSLHDLGCAEEVCVAAAERRSAENAPRHKQTKKCKWTLLKKKLPQIIH